MDFYQIGKLFWVVASPEFWPLLAGCIVLIKLFRGRIRSAGIWMTGLVLVLAVITFFPIGNLMLRPLETRFEQVDPPHIDGIIILGGAGLPDVTNEWNQASLGPRAERVLAGLALARSHPDATVVYSGRTERLMDLAVAEPLSAKIMALGDLGPIRFIREAESRSTFENAAFTRALINPKPNETWVLITSAWHLPRAIGAFCNQGLTLLPFPVDYLSGRNASRTPRLSQNLSDISTAFHEYVGLFAYRLSGRSLSLFPKGC